MKMALSGLVIALVFCWASRAGAQTNFATLVSNGAWTWFNDPRAVFHNGALYFGYVRNGDGHTVLSAFNPATGLTTNLWMSALTQSDDHNNPGLLVKQDGTLLAIHARHGSDQFFSYRYSFTTNPVMPVDWSAELTISATGAGLTYANPFQLSAEAGKIYNFSRNQNFNPTVFTSTNGGANWSAPQLFIQTGGGGVRPYVKYASDYAGRIDFLYTDGHPRNVDNSLYHAYYEGGTLYKTDGSVIKSFSAIPMQHDSGERGSVIYQYSAANSSDPNEHIPTGRAWCWETAYQTNGQPVCVFTVQRDNVTGPNWFDDRIFYYYARWTGSNWQKRFIAHAGRPLYSSEDDYAGGIAVDPENPNVVYISSNAADPFNLSDTTNVALRANDRYEIFRGETSDGGLTFNWTPVTANSAADNLRPYVPRHHGGNPAVIWFRGAYSTYTTYNCAVVGMFSTPVPQPPVAAIVKPASSPVTLTNLNNQLKLEGVATDDGSPGPLTVAWSTVSGPTNAVFSAPTSSNTTAQFPLPGTYVLRFTASDSALTGSAETTVRAGDIDTDQPDATRVLWLKLDETSGASAADSSGNGYNAALAGGTTWQPAGGMRGGALKFDGASGIATVSDNPDLDSTTAFTLAYWFRADAYPPDSAGLVSKRDGPSSNNAYTTYLKADDKRVYVDIESGNNRFASATLIETGIWHHVTLVFDGSLPAAQRAQLWINGSLDVTANESSAAIGNHPSHFRIGSTPSTAPTWLNGAVDDVRFYRRALVPDEILLLAVTNFAPSVATGPAPAPISAVAASLNGAVTDDGRGGPVTTMWEKASGPGQVSFSNSANPATMVTFGQAGSYTLRLSAADNDAEVCADLAVNVGLNTNVYEDWISLAYPGITNSAVIGFGADPDGDGVKNGVEFGLGMIASVADATPFGGGQPGLPRPTIMNIGGTNFLAMLAQRPVGRIGLAYDAKVAGDFTNWTGAIQAGPPVNNGDGTEMLTYRDIQPMSDANQRFMRLEISRP